MIDLTLAQITEIARNIKGMFSTDIFETSIRHKMRLCVSERNADAAHTHARLYPADEAAGGGDPGEEPGDGINRLDLTGTFDKTAIEEIAHGLTDITKIKSVSVFVQV